jgi:hypothetical protein
MYKDNGNNMPPCKVGSSTSEITKGTSMNRTYKMPIAIALCSVSVLAAGYLQVKAQEVGHAFNMQDVFKAHTTRAGKLSMTFTKSTKLCSALLSPNSRDTIDAPNNWGSSTCQNFAWSIGSDNYQLGCANPDNVSWGNANGGTPSDDRCNWQ